MSYLIPPPKYVEYPRDPKYRPQDDIDRLWVMCDGNYWLTWPPVLAWWPAMHGTGTHFEISIAIYMGVKVVLLCGAFFALRAALARVFFAKGWSGRYAIPLSVLLIAPAFSAFASVPVFSSLVLTYLPLVGVWFWVQSLIKREFRKCGMPVFWTLDSRQLERMVEEVRSRNPVEGSPAPPSRL